MNQLQVLTQMLAIMLEVSLKDFASNNKKTILIASHNMNEVERLCDEVLMMKKGEIIDKGKSVRFRLVNMEEKTLEEVFLKIVRE